MKKYHQKKTLKEVSKLLKKAVIILSVFVVFMTTYSLVLPAITIDEDSVTKDDGIFLEKTENDGEVESEETEFTIESDQNNEQFLNKEDDSIEGIAATDEDLENVNTEEEKNELPKEDVSYPAMSFSTSLSDTLVLVEAPEGALPENTEMRIEEVNSDGLIESINESIKNDEDISGNKRVDQAKAFDITFIYNDEIVEPDLPLKVSITSLFMEKIDDEPLLYHMEENDEVGKVASVVPNEEELEVISEEYSDAIKEHEEISELTSDNTVSFESDSFSVYVIVYTVDFHYEINEEFFELSIPGGSYIALRDIIDVLGVKEGGSVQEFIADVETVEFSDPNLVWVGKADQETTLGSLKETNNLVVEYSAELNEEELREIDSKIVQEGEWILISILPFESEESLTITLTDGEVYVIGITDSKPADTQFADFAAGNTNRFVIWSTGGSDGKPYALKGDGTTAEIDPVQIDMLGQEFLWTITPGIDGRYVFRPISDNTKALVLNGYHTLPSEIVSSNGNANIYLYPPYTDHKNQQDDGRSSNNPGWIVEGWNWTRLNLGWSSHQFESHNQYCSNINITKQEHLIALNPTNGNGVLQGNPDSGNVTSTQYKKMKIDGIIIDDNDDANLDKARIYIPVQYNDNGTATIMLPSNSQLDSFSVSDIDPVTSHSIVQDQDKYQWVLHGWINIATGEYYDVTGGAVTAIVNKDNLNVFYADWWAADYNYTIPEDQLTSTVDTSNFVSIKMWDYNELYNLTRSNVWKVDGDARKYIQRDNIESEEWYIKNGPYFQFVDNTDPANCWQYGTLGNTQDRGRYNQWSNYSYSGTLGILGEQGQVPSTGVLQSLFPDTVTPGSGVNYLGTGNYLFHYNEETKTYSYDSAANAAVYNQSEERFYVSNTDKKYYRGPGYYESTVGGFFPLNDYGKTLTYNNGTTNNWLGISIDLDFWLPDTPGSENANLLANHPMRFEFNGDDDVWVLIDGKLALDIGGIHEAVGGYIDFSTGEIRNAKGDTYKLSDMGIGAGAHTLSFYYLEQGGNASNCKITFNLAPRWDEEPEVFGRASVTKTWSADTPETARQPLSFYLKDDEGNVVKGSTVNYDDGTVNDNIWSYVWENLNPTIEYKIVEATDPRFDVSSTHETEVIENCWAAASYHKDSAFGSAIILLGNDLEDGKLLKEDGSSDTAVFDDHVVMNPVSDDEKWTVEGYDSTNQHFYLKNSSGKYLSIKNGNISLVELATNASWFYMSPSGDLNDANSKYRLIVNGDGSIAAGVIVNSADETDHNSENRIHVYTYHDGIFAKRESYAYTNSFRKKDITVRKAWSDSETVNHDNDTITIALYQYALNENQEFVAVEEYSLANDTITGSGSITISDLPVAGVFEGEYVTYEYHVSEKTGKKGYISVVEQDSEGTDTWVITNIAPDDSDETTSLNVTKLWKDKDGNDASENHESDNISFKLIQKAVDSDYVPVTMRWVNYRGGLIEELYYIQKGSDFSFAVSKPGTMLSHGVTVWTDREQDDNDQWNSANPETHTFSIENITDSIAITARLTFLNDEWGDDTSWILQRWGHSVPASENLLNNLDAVVEASKNNVVIDTQETIYSFSKNAIEDGPYTESAFNWVASLRDLPLYKKVGAGSYHIFYYSISEISVNGEQVEPSGTTTAGQNDDFTVSIDQENMTITNTEKEKTIVTATKEWTNADGSHTPPENSKIAFELFANGETTGKIVKLNGIKDVSENPGDSEETIEEADNNEESYESDSWVAVWNNLQKYTYGEDGAIGEQINYTIKEMDNSIPEGYAVEYGPESEYVINGGTITNRQLTTSLEVVKVDAIGMSETLAGAKFELREIDPSTGSYIGEAVLPVTTGSGNKTGTDGKAIFEKLVSGYYEIKETEVPAGYILAGEGKFYIKVENGTVWFVEKGTDDQWHRSSDTNEMHFIPENATSPATAMIGNTPGVALPHTGGSGTKLFYTFGIALFSFAGMGLLIEKKRKMK